MLMIASHWKNRVSDQSFAEENVDDRMEPDEQLEDRVKGEDSSGQSKADPYSECGVSTFYPVKRKK